jgi:DNA-binding LacI/PurR family transcriptional regulator
MEECGIKTSDSWSHFDLYGLEAALAERLMALPESERPDAVVCHGVGQAETLMKAFAERGLPLLGTGAVEGGYGGPAIPICVDGTELGSTAAELLLWKLHRPQRACLRVGVPMTLVLHGAQVGSSVSSTAATKTGHV